jgi:hypothetical protein
LLRHTVAVPGDRLQRRALAAASLLATVLCVADAMFGVCVGLAHLAPFFVVLAPLVLGRYPGERRLAAALVARPSPAPPARRRRRPPRAHRAPPSHVAAP